MFEWPASLKQLEQVKVHRIYTEEAGSPVHTLLDLAKKPLSIIVLTLQQNCES